MPQVIGEDAFGDEIIELLPGEYFYCNTCKMHVPKEDAEECVCGECGDPLEIKKTPLKDRILNEMVKEKKENPLADYQLYKAAKKILFSLTKEEGLELNKNSFVSIAHHFGGYGKPIKLFDTTDYAVAWCKYCEEDQPVSFTGHVSTYKGTLNNGVFVWCDECNHVLMTFDHIANGEKIEELST